MGLNYYNMCSDNSILVKEKEQMRNFDSIKMNKIIRTIQKGLCFPELFKVRLLLTLVNKM